MASPSSKRRLYTSLGIAALVLWSTTVALGRSLGEQLGPLTSASVIYLLGGVLGCVHLVLARQGIAAIRSMRVRYLLGCGGLFALYMACLYGGLGLATTRHQAMQVGLLNYLWPMLTLLLSVPILKMRATALLVPGALIATAGVFLGTMPRGASGLQIAQAGVFAHYLPYLLGIAAAISWALYSTLSRRWAGHSRGGAVPIFMLGTGVLLAVARLVSAEHPNWTGRAVRELLFLAISTNLAYAFWEQAMRRGDLVFVAACSYLTPLLSTGVSSLYLGVVPGIRLWIGCLLVILGATTCKLALREPPTRPIANQRDV
jgi:drug/metabolite transporter (DMT)-like permease